MRKPYTVYRLRGQPAYRIAFWDGHRYRPRSASMLRLELGIPAVDLSPTTRAGAEAIGRLALDAGLGCQDSSNFLQHVAGFWAADSDYLAGREARKKPLSAVYVTNCRSAIAKYLRPYLEETGQLGLGLARVTAPLLEGWVLWLQRQGLGPARINGILKAVRTPLGRAYRLGRLRDNPARLVERLPDPAPRREILELEEARRFFALPWADPRYYAANLIAAMTGLRLGEIRGLQAEDVRGDYLHVCHNWQDAEPAGRKMKGPKHSTLVNIKVRDVPMPPKLGAVFRELIECSPFRDGFVLWGDRAGAPPSTTIIERHYYAGLRAIGIGEEERKRRALTFHAWRHWYNTNIRPYVPEYQLRLLTGHSDTAMSDRYTAITQEQRQAVAKVAERLLPETPSATPPATAGVTSP